jgi:enoyl-CoA hydratase/carnithine racemase
MNSLVFEYIANDAYRSNRDPFVRVSVMTTNVRAFAAGAEIKRLASELSPIDRIDRYIEFCSTRLPELAKPIIAAIAGYALSGGLRSRPALRFSTGRRVCVFGLPEIIQREAYDRQRQDYMKETVRQRI